MFGKNSKTTASLFLIISLFFWFEPTQAQEPKEQMHVGFIGTNEFETPVNQRVTPTGQQVELPGMRPQALAMSPDGKLLATSGETHELVVLDAESGRILQHVGFPADSAGQVEPGPVSTEILHPDTKAQLSFTGLIFSADGSRIFLSNVNGDIKVFAVKADHKVAPLRSIQLPAANAPRRTQEIPAGMAISRDGKHLFVALNLSNRLADIDPESGKLRRMWDVGVSPYDVILKGEKVYVSNWGGRRPDPHSLTGPAGRGTLVRVDSIRHIASEGSVTVIDLTGKREQMELQAGLHASAMAIAPNGRYIAVANAGSDTISLIDTRVDKVVETIWARRNPADLFGAQPNAITFDNSGRTLFVCNGTQNAVAAIRFSPGESKLSGLIPVGWFPGAIVCDGKRQKLWVANIKGLPHGRNRKSDGKVEFNSMQWNGSLTIVQVPSRNQLEQLTKQALENLRYPRLLEATQPARPNRVPMPVPERAGEPSVFKHVIYVIKENRTYDQVLGDIEKGNGEPALCTFGEKVTPNQHKLVKEYVLLDNTYCSGSRSSDGHQWTDSAMVTDYLEKSFAGFPRSYPAGGDILTEDALAYSPAGFIWDNVLGHGKTVRDYGEFSQARVRWKDPTRKERPGYLDVYRQFVNNTDEIAIWSEPNIESLRPHLVTNTVGWDLGVPDVFRAAQFTNDIKRFESGGGFPDLSIIWLPNDHTGGTSPGAPTPAAQVADNDLAFGQIVEAVSHSRFWKDTCIFAIEDDPQSGWDHVSGYRTTAYIASAYTKRGKVVSTQYNTTSLLRTIELILGLPPLNQMDATATPMFDCFVNVPDLTPFVAVRNNIPLDQVNPKKMSNAILQHDAYVSSRLPLDQADRCPDGVLNRILWHAMAGPEKPYPTWAVKEEDD